MKTTSSNVNSHRDYVKILNNKRTIIEVYCQAVFEVGDKIRNEIKFLKTGILPKQKKQEFLLALLRPQGYVLSIPVNGKMNFFIFKIANNLKYRNLFV